VDIDSQSASLSSLCSVCQSLGSEHVCCHDVTDLQRTLDELKSQLDIVKDKAAHRRRL